MSRRAQPLLAVVIKDHTSIIQTLRQAVVSQAALPHQHLLWLLLRLLHATVMIAHQLHHPPSASANGKRTMLRTANRQPTRRSDRSLKSPAVADQHLRTRSHRPRLRVTALIPHRMLAESTMATTRLKLLITLHHFPQ